MKEIFKFESREECHKRIEKEIDDKRNEYLNTYSQGFSIEELIAENDKTKEEMKTINNKVDVLESQIKEPKYINSYLILGAIITNALINIILNNPLVSLISTTINLIFIIWNLKRIKDFKHVIEQKEESFELKKESLFLELKVLTINKILIDNFLEKEDC